MLIYNTGAKPIKKDCQFGSNSVFVWKEPRENAKQGHPISERNAPDPLKSGIIDCISRSSACVCHFGNNVDLRSCFNTK